MSVFNHIGHCVTDVARSRRFYEGLLGFEFLREIQPPDDPSCQLVGVAPPANLTAVYLQRDGFVLELLHFGREGNPPAARRVMNEPGLTHLSVSVDDIYATAEAATGYGGEVVAGSDIGFAIMIRDPDGQLIELLPMSYRQMVET